MRKSLPFLLLLSSFCLAGFSQITTPVIKANFGVDADLRCNYFDEFVQSGNDDWFKLPASTGTGQFIIDTTGAAALLAGYNSNVASRRLPFYRNMRFPGFTVVNNRLLLDAVFIRDYHGDDSTVFSGGNKNGDNPNNWSCPISQGIPDKNDILDMMVHVRRAGPNRTDSLWMFGGLSLDNTTGNRYFDFEMYQTDIYYDRTSRKFYGYGPDAGHTSWQFDAAGNITVPGDIIFSAEYQSSSLTNIEARIWVNRAALSITPVSFDWTGVFDGASSGATYGYAAIRPKAVGTYYTGLQCVNGTWAGPFSAVLQDNSVITNYSAKQFVEFSVNLTKLGLDPVTLLGSNSCGMPFRRVLVKTRASSSFTAELKDFVGPFDFFLAPRVQVATSSPYICNQASISEVNVTNPVATSVYKWTTTDGNIVSTPTGPTIYVDKPGTYIVTQYLQEGCSAYATDTIQFFQMSFCEVLSANRITDFTGNSNGENIILNWKVQDNDHARFFEVQRSTDGINFKTIDQVNKQDLAETNGIYRFETSSEQAISYYRVKLFNADKSVSYSKIYRSSSIYGNSSNKVVLYPNPAKDAIRLQIQSPVNTTVKFTLYNSAGAQVLSTTNLIQKGTNTIKLNDLPNAKAGMYLAVMQLGDEIIREKLVINK
ncbi:MAG: T9SS type A sorting domain-containing protein [Chitinophagaceae bacterium]|nr:MAG: T9SS type A sorting domain-containing protein [Chitinophagaceae bacterium]